MLIKKPKHIRESGDAEGAILKRREACGGGVIAGAGD
jgi:hypothetical protein